MNSSPLILSLLLFVNLSAALSAQTLYVPGGAASGIGNNTTNGNVGIGTTTPAANLEVAGPADSFTYISAANSGTGRGRLGFKTAGTMQWQLGTGMSVDGSTYVNDFGIYQQGTGQLPFYISTAGNVGIGTATPAVKLHVAAASAAGDGIEIEGNATNQYPSLRFVASNAASSRSWSMSVRGGAAGQFNLDDNTAGYTRLAIDTAGNVGIGTTSPGSAKLAVVGSAEAGFTNNPYVLLLRDTSGMAAGVGGGVVFEGSYTGTSPIAFGAISGIKENGSDMNYAGALTFMTRVNGSGAGNQERMRISSAGNVGIGTTNPTQKLSVNGTVRAKEVIVDTGWPDYVFDKSYRLKSLSEVEAHIEIDGHLPDIPSAQEVADHGISVGEMQAKLLAKIEELTLHAIAQEKRMTKLEGENAELRAVVTELERRQ